MKRITIILLMSLSMLGMFIFSSVPIAGKLYIPSQYGNTLYVNPWHSRVRDWGLARYASPWAANGMPAEVHQIKRIAENVGRWCDRYWDSPGWTTQWKKDYYQLEWAQIYDEVDLSCNNRAVLLAAALRTLHNSGKINANIVFVKGIQVQEDKTVLLREPILPKGEHWWLQITLYAGTVPYWIWVDAYSYTTRYGPIGFKYQTSPFQYGDVFTHPTAGKFKCSSIDYQYRL